MAGECQRRGLSLEISYRRFTLQLEKELGNSGCVTAQMVGSGGRERQGERSYYLMSPVSPPQGLPSEEVLQWVPSPAVGSLRPHTRGWNTIITMRRVLGGVYFYPNCQHHHSVCNPNLHSAYKQHVALLRGQLLSPGLSHAWISFKFCLIKNVIMKMGE